MQFLCLALASRGRLPVPSLTKKVVVQYRQRARGVAPLVERAELPTRIKPNVVRVRLIVGSEGPAPINAGVWVASGAANLGPTLSDSFASRCGRWRGRRERQVVAESELRDPHR